MDVHCCKCMKRREDDGWRWTDGFTDRPVSYSYCPECLEEFRNEAGYARRDFTRRTEPALVFAFA